MTEAATGAGWVGAAYREALSTQSYGRTQITGVELRGLRLFSDEGGDFCEVVRWVPSDPRWPNSPA